MGANSEKDLLIVYWYQILQTKMETLYRVLHGNITLACPFRANPVEV
jgi:hypothetical protein